MGKISCKPLKTFRNHEEQAIRPRPEGPDEATCTIKERSSGRIVTKATGRKLRHRSAAGMAKRYALQQLKKKIGCRYNLDDYELIYS